jgi:glycosyltransferase involved in cell wall biosynthesis
MRYVVITPVRNEKAHFPKTIASMVAQTVRPLRWVIVNDGSSDGTGVLADQAARAHDWIQVVHRPDRGRRLPGSGVMQAFIEGCTLVANLSWRFLVKLDGDLAFAPEYFEHCLAHFEHDPRLGIGGSIICTRVGDRLVPEAPDDPAFHVRGATKIYRRTCWEQIGGLIALPGWDTVDELRANMLGWRTRTFPELQVEQLKSTGSADGRWRNGVKNGVANYVACYHPAFMLGKCLRRALQRPYLFGGLALAWGYFGACVKRLPRVQDPEFRRYVRRQQWRCLWRRPSLWSERLRLPEGPPRLASVAADVAPPTGSNSQQAPGGKGPS